MIMIHLILTTDDLTVNDYVSGPEPDNNPKYRGGMFGSLELQWRILIYP